MTRPWPLGEFKSLGHVCVSVFVRMHECVWLLCRGPIWYSHVLSLTCTRNIPRGTATIETAENKTRMQPCEKENWCILNLVNTSLAGSLQPVDTGRRKERDKRKNKHKQTDEQADGAVREIFSASSCSYRRICWECTFFLVVQYRRGHIKVWDFVCVCVCVCVCARIRACLTKQLQISGSNGTMLW